MRKTHATLPAPAPVPAPAPASVYDPRPPAPVYDPRPPVEERGELVLALDGSEMALRPSYEAIEQFEVETGRGLLELSRAGLNGTLRLGEVAQIATACIRAWGRANNTSYAAVNAPRIGELILESEGGLHAAMQTISGMLALAVTGKYTAQGEVKAGTTKTTTMAGVPAAS